MQGVLDLAAGMALAALVGGDGLERAAARRFGGALAPAWDRAFEAARRGRSAIPGLIDKLRPEVPPGFRPARPVDRGVVRALARLHARDDHEAIAAADRIMLEAIAWRA